MGCCEFALSFEYCREYRRQKFKRKISILNLIIPDVNVNLAPNIALLGHLFALLAPGLAPSPLLAPGLAPSPLILWYDDGSFMNLMLG